jgi:hypothetical protein
VEEGPLKSSTDSAREHLWASVQCNKVWPLPSVWVCRSRALELGRIINELCIFKSIPQILRFLQRLSNLNDFLRPLCKVPWDENVFLVW